MYLSTNCSATRQSSFAVCSFGKYATKLDHSIGHDTFKSREQNVSNNEDNRDYEAFVIFCYTRM